MKYFILPLLFLFAVCKAESIEQMKPRNDDVFRDKIVPVQPHKPTFSEHKWRDPTTGMRFAWVPAGCFQMGRNDSGISDNEKPRHEVCLSRGYWLGKYEVTKKEFRQFVQSSDFGGDGEDYWFCDGIANPTFNQKDDEPAVCVSWTEIQKFISWMNQQGQGIFRLPTEAEWEYACRSGGKDEPFCGRNDMDPDEWYLNNNGSNTLRIGRKQPNGLSLYDMTGNVWEWVQDWKGRYPSHSVTDPTGPKKSDKRIYRGGGWFRYASSIRSGYDLIFYFPTDRSSYVGFRLLRQP